jgi:hypothetical protein
MLDENEEHGWVVSYNKNGKLVKYKYEEGCPMVTCQCTCEVDAPIENVLCLFAEIDLFTEWFPQLK